MVIAYVLFYLFALGYEQSSSLKDKKSVLVISCMLLAILAGFRNQSLWADTEVYVMNFIKNTNSLLAWSFSDKPLGYSEYSFYLLGVFVKTFTSNVTVYLLFIAALSFLFMYKDFKRYCYYPLFGVCVYISRFYLARNFIQIRAGLSYAIILWGVQYITKRDWKKYFFWVFIGYLFHHSALLAVPLYFLCMLRLKRWHIFMGIIVAFILTLYFRGSIMALVGENAEDLKYQTYVIKEYQREQGLLNPMIYFQLFILFMYTFYESVLRRTTTHYYTIRTAYFYSTFILISLSMYTALSGRTSSMFSTLEMAIIPTLANTFVRKNRMVAYLGIGIVLTTIFYMNINKL